MKITTAFILVEIEGDDKLRQVILTKQQQQILIQLMPMFANNENGVISVMESHIETVAIGRAE